MNINFEIIKKYKNYVFAPILLIFSLFICFKLYEGIFGYFVMVKFVELGPLYNSMPVYYKGYKIGKTKNIKPSEDYKYTLVRIILYPKKLGLPENISAKVKKLESGKDYIELIYPKEPSSNNLRNGSIIEGKTSMDIQSFMSAQADSGALTSMSDNLSKTLTSAEKTSNEIKAFFADTRVILKDNRQNLRATTENTAETMENLALMSGSLADLTSKINNSIPEDKIKNTISNIDKSSTNIKESTESLKSILISIDIATKNLDKTIAKIDSTIDEANKIAINIKKMTAGFCDVLGKRFAGMRIIFGKPMKGNTCASNCYK